MIMLSSEFPGSLVAEVPADRAAAEVAADRAAAEDADAADVLSVQTESPSIRWY